MPGSDALYGPESGVADLYPEDEDEHKRLLGEAVNAFIAAESARRPHYDRWQRFYKLYRSYISREPKTWNHKTFYPIIFYVIETVLPRLIAALPKIVVKPVAEDDVEASEHMEELLGWAAENSDLYVTLADAVKDALVYGTGILKVYWHRETEMGRNVETTETPVMQTIDQPALDPETGEPIYDVDANPVTEPQEVPTGEVTTQTEYVKTEYVVYEGPKAEAVDPFHFFVAPEAEDIESARYVIHRTYREMSYIMEKVEEGVFRLPDWISEDEITADKDEPRMDREGEVELWQGDNDPTRQPQELLEIWTRDKRVITVLNRRAIIRHTETPFDHGRKPFVRICDIKVPHEFWGIGEIEPLEGLQDNINSMVNQRMDNIRLTLNRMFAVNIHEINDIRELESRPGGIIQVTGDLPARDVVLPLDLGDVTASVFGEVEYSERTVEKVSGVSAEQLGTGANYLAPTATASTIRQDNAQTRFALKTRLMELTGLKPLARQFGSLLQQFIDIPRAMRILGPDGAWAFPTFTPEAIQGALDYDIEVASATETDAMRKDQKMTLLQVAGTLWPQAIPKLLEDLLRAFGIKDPQTYIGPTNELGMPVDPATGFAVDPATGQPLDPATGQPMDPMTAQMMAEAQGGGAPVPNGQEPMPPMPELTPEEQQMLIAELTGGQRA